MKIQNEIWKDVKGYEGLYQISNFGIVKSCARIIIRNNGTNLTLSGKVKTPSTTKNGYYYVALWNRNKHKHALLHRILSIAFIPNPENKKEVNHKDGNKKNNSLENLEWVTHQENGMHSYKMGMTPKPTGNNKKGEEVYNSVLKTRDVINIRQYFEYGGVTQKQLSEIFNVSRSCIQGITRRKTWKHI